MNRRGFLRLVGGALSVLGLVGLPPGILAPARAWIGKGTDWDITIRENETLRLDRDLHCRNLSVLTGGRLIPNGHRIFARGSFTLGG